MTILETHTRLDLQRLPVRHTRADGGWENMNKIDSIEHRSIDRGYRCARALASRPIESCLVVPSSYWSIGPNFLALSLTVLKTRVFRSALKEILAGTIYNDGAPPTGHSDPLAATVANINKINIHLLG